jgi:hypothetical protein
MLTEYEEDGATTFIAELSDVGDNEVDALAEAM